MMSEAARGSCRGSCNTRPDDCGWIEQCKHPSQPQDKSKLEETLEASVGSVFRRLCREQGPRYSLEK